MMDGKLKKEKSCGAIVYSENGEVKYLLVKHVKSAGGHWDFPKGHIEKDEELKETAKREVKEETGIEIEIASGFMEEISYTPAKNVIKTVVFFLGKALNYDLRIQEEEISSAKWMSYSEAMNVLTFETSKKLLEKAEIFLNKEKH